MDAFEREHGDQRLELAGDLAGEQPYRVEADDNGERAEHIDRLHMADDAIGEIFDPPGQRRMLPVAELPLLAEREALGQIELQVPADQHRHDGPHHEVETEHPDENLAWFAAGKLDQRRKHFSRAEASGGTYHPENSRSSMGLLTLPRGSAARASRRFRRSALPRRSAVASPRACRRQCGSSNLPRRTRAPCNRSRACRPRPAAT